MPLNKDLTPHRQPTEERYGLVFAAPTQKHAIFEIEKDLQTLQYLSLRNDDIRELIDEVEDTFRVILSDLKKTSNTKKSTAQLQKEMAKKLRDSKARYKGGKASE